MGQRPSRRDKTLIAAVVGVCVALVLSGCASTVGGRAVSIFYDPSRVGGLPVTDGPSGPGDNLPAPIGTVQNTDGGDIDRLALLSVNDIQDYWKQNYGGLKGSFTPVDTFISYGSKSLPGLNICGVDTYSFVNAFYCYGHNMMAWDRGVLLPMGKHYFGDMAITATLAHEYGHAVQDMATLVDRSTPTLVAEQQADCFAGTYLHWVAEGNSARFSLNTTDGLNGLLAALISLRDPVPGPHDDPMAEAVHGTALDRVSAFQKGFDTGVVTCAGIDTADIEHRRGGTPASLPREHGSRGRTGRVDIDKDTLSALMETLNASFAPARPPVLSFDGAPCADADVGPPVSYCPASNTVSVDLAGLQQMQSGADAAKDTVMLQGDNTVFSVVTSRYMLALQRERGVELASSAAGLRTACLTGVVQSTMTADDLDEAVTGLLTNGLAASDVNGDAVPAGFSRILAFRSGLFGDAEQCYERFP
jgi:predicted metalloprotease